MDDFRKQIDDIDAQLMELLDKRFKLTHRIGKIKQKEKRPIEDTRREQEIQTKAQSFVYEKEIQKVYQTIFIESKNDQSLRYGLVGKKLPYSFSPSIFKALGLDGYRLIETDDFQKTMEKIGDVGVNVTIPYKTEAYHFCQALDESAQHTKTVNTIIDGKGYNTDYLGFRDILLHYDIDLKAKKVVIIGNGATSRTFDALTGFQAQFLVRSKKNERETYIDSYNELSDCEVLINTTPYGTYPQIESKPLFPLDAFKHCLYVIDVVYNPMNTPLLIEAKKHHIKTIGGLELLVAQAYHAYRLFTNQIYEFFHSLVKRIYQENLNIVLIGLPFSGKTTIGKHLARDMQKTFVDMDDELAKDGHDLNTLIHTESIEAFRNYEVEKACTLGVLHGQVIATGGGIVLSDKAMSYLRLNGIIVWLDVTLETLIKRIDHQRPLIQSPNDLIQLAQERYSLYEKYCHIRVKEPIDINQIMEKINDTMDY